jgi:hypothetical protein
MVPERLFFHREIMLDTSEVAWYKAMLDNGYQNQEK